MGVIVKMFAIMDELIGALSRKVLHPSTELDPMSGCMI